MRGTVTRVEMFPDAHLVTFPWVSFLQPNVTSACVCWQTYIQAGVGNQGSRSPWCYLGLIWDSDLSHQFEKRREQTQSQTAGFHFCVSMRRGENVPTAQNTRNQCQNSSQASHTRVIPHVFIVLICAPPPNREHRRR